jgi:hypothetical protein
MTEQTIPWGEDENLGCAWWDESAKICNATNQQKIFAACYHSGWTATASARAAKYSGNEDTLRQAGHRASHSTAVQSLLGMAHAATGTGPSGCCEIGEVKSILSRIARQSDSNSRLRACEVLARIHEREQERERENPTATDIKAEIAEIAKIDVQLAKAYAADKGINWRAGSNE